MKTTEEIIDPVEMMHEGALRMYEETKDMTREEELAYWRRKNEEMRRKYPKTRSMDQACRAAT